MSLGKSKVLGERFAIDFGNCVFGRRWHRLRQTSSIRMRHCMLRYVARLGLECRGRKVLAAHENPASSDSNFVEI